MATPAVAASGFDVQERTAPEVPDPAVMARVTLLVFVVTVLPKLSCAATAGWLVKAVFWSAFDGWTVKPSFVAEAGEITRLAETPVAPVGLSVARSATVSTAVRVTDTVAIPADVTPRTPRLATGAQTCERAGPSGPALLRRSRNDGYFVLKKATSELPSSVVIVAR